MVLITRMVKERVPAPEHPLNATGIILSFWAGHSGRHFVKLAVKFDGIGGQADEKSFGLRVSGFAEAYHAI